MIKKQNFLKKIGAAVLLQIMALPAITLAQAPAGTTVAGMPAVNVPTNINIDGMLGKIASYFFGIVIAVCVFMVLWGAFDLATSSGDEGKVTTARKRILFAAIGMVVAALSSVIVSVVRNAIGA